MTNILFDHIKNARYFALILCLNSCATSKNIDWLERTTKYDLHSGSETKYVSAEIVFIGVKKCSQSGQKDCFPEFEICIINRGYANIVIDFPYNWMPSFLNSTPVLNFNFIDCHKKQIGCNMSVAIARDGSQLAPVQVVVNKSEKVSFRFILINKYIDYSTSASEVNLVDLNSMITTSDNWKYLFRFRYVANKHDFFWRDRGLVKWLELKTNVPPADADL